MRDLAKKKEWSRDRERVQCFRLATCKLSWPEHRAPVLGELLVSGSGLMCQRRRDESVSQPSIVLAAPTQLPRYRYGFLAPLLDVLAQPVEAFLEATLLEDRAPVGSGVGLGFGSGLGPGLAWGWGWGQGWGEGEGEGEGAGEGEG